MDWPYSDDDERIDDLLEYKRPEYYEDEEEED